MAIYRLKIPTLKAIQFDGKNHEEIKKLLGDDSPGEDISFGTGKLEEPKKEKKPEGHGHDKPSAAPAVPAAEPPKEIREKLRLKVGDWVTVDPANSKVEVNPKDFPDKFEIIG